MKHLRETIILVMVSLFFLASCGQHVEPKNSDNEATHEHDHNNINNDQGHSNKNEAQVLSSSGMKVAFYYPVVQVDGTRARKVDPLDPERILVSVPEDSKKQITLRFLDSEEKEREIRGWIHVKRYTQYSKPEGESGKVVDIAPDNAEDVYERIYRTGYGELTIRENVDLELEEELGPVLVKLELGSKKKSEGIEFRFRQGIIHTVSGKSVPASLFFTEDSRNNIAMTIDEGFVKLKGTLEVYKNNHYTRLAPVWIDFDETTRERLRSQGSNVQVALYVPSDTTEERDGFVTTLDPNNNPLDIGKQKGTVVALLKLRSVAGW